MTNIAMNPVAKSIGVAKRNRPPHMVAIQLKILIPVGTEIRNVIAPKKEFNTGPSPTTNMWCAHTPSEMKPMLTVAATMSG